MRAMNKRQYVHRQQNDIEGPCNYTSELYWSVTLQQNQLHREERDIESTHLFYYFNTDGLKHNTNN